MTLKIQSSGVSTNLYDVQMQNNAKKAQAVLEEFCSFRRISAEISDFS
jgi:hypothetical protein